MDADDTELILQVFIFPSGLAPKLIYNCLQEQKDFFINELVKDGYAPRKSVEIEFKLALDFLTYLVESVNFKSVVSTGTFSCLSLFQILIDVHFSCFFTERNAISFITMQSLLSIPKFLIEKINVGKFDTILFPVIEIKIFQYGTLVVTEAADIHSVVDEVTKSWKNLRQPWVVRKVLVQENVKEKFLSLLEKNLPKIDDVYQADKMIVQAYGSIVKDLQEKGIKLIQSSNDDTFKATIAIGVPISHLKKNKTPTLPIIVLDSFRTVKEGIDLANKEGNKEFVSIWSENITETFEYVKNIKASTVWVNCHGVLDKNCPFVIERFKYNMKCGKFNVDRFRIFFKFFFIIFLFFLLFFAILLQ